MRLVRVLVIPWDYQWCLVESVVASLNSLWPTDGWDLGQHWFRQWLDAWWHQAIAWTNVDLSSMTFSGINCRVMHDDVIKWKHFLHYWPFVWGIHRSLVNSPHKGLWCGALMFSLNCAWISGLVKNQRDADDLRYHHTQYDVIVMVYLNIQGIIPSCVICWHL